MGCKYSILRHIYVPGNYQKQNKRYSMVSVKSREKRKGGTIWELIAGIPLESKFREWQSLINYFNA